MAPDIKLPRYVQCKRGKHFYFRRVANGEETRHPLPHPLEPGFRRAYNEAWFKSFGAWPEDAMPPKSVSALIAAHRPDSEAYRKLSAKSRQWRDRACDLLCARWGTFDARDIRAEHCQALYDSLSAKPQTANRIWADISKLFSWGRPRGFCTENPALGIERVEVNSAYEPWPLPDLERLVRDGQEHIVEVALMALYTGQDRGDVLERLTDAAIAGEVWELHRGKTRKVTRDRIRITLHPVAMAVVEKARARKREAGIIDPARPLLLNSRGEPWGSGFGASWTKELHRLGLSGREPRLTFKGLRVTNATLIADAAAKGHASAAEAFARVRAMLGHHSDKMSQHYARRAEVEVSNRGSVEMLPTIKRGDS